MTETQRDEHLPLTLVTYRDVFQLAAKHQEGVEGAYQQRSSVVRLNPEDMKTLGVKDGDPVRLSNTLGEMIAKAKADRSCQPGFGFVPVSHYVNKLTSYDPGKRRLPDFKQVSVVIQPVAA